MPDPPQQAPAVTVEHITKRFRTPEEATHTLKERVLHPMRGRGHREFTALDDVTFDVAPGEFFGIVGRNGSGKSTLLKCLAGIYGVDTGRMFKRGRMSTFIELGVGFNPDLAAYDNVVLNGIMMGLTPAEAKARYREVIEFAELEEFQDLKLKNYSSGMHVRLAFSVAIQVDADVLLIDEVLAVGDAAFQQKCFDVFNRMRDEERTILFVTHDMGSVNRFCHRALLLDHGKVDIIGSPREVGDRYLELNFSHQAERAREQGKRPGNGRARIADGWIEDHQGVRHDHFLSGTRNTFHAMVEFNETVEDPSLTLAFPNEHGQNVFILSTILDHDRTGTFQAGDRAHFAVTFENILAPGRYELLANLAHRGTGAELIDGWEKQLSIVVLGFRPTGGLVDVECEWQIENSSRDHLESPRLMATVEEILDRGEEIKGPSAIGGDWRRTASLTSVIARSDFKLRFFGSVLGYVWQLMRPLMLFGVLYVMFTKIFPVSTEPNFGVALLLGIVLFTFFAEATGGAVTCVMDRENLVRKIQFPRMVIPLAVVTTACFNLVLNLVVVAIFAALSGLRPHFGWLQLFPLLALLIVFSAGIAMLLSALYVRYRDIQPIWDVVLQATFYGSLILVPYETVIKQPGYADVASALLANPLAAVVQQSRHVIVDPAYFNLADAMGSAGLMLIPLALVVATFALGLRVFNREAPRIAEEL